MATDASPAAAIAVLAVAMRTAVGVDAVETYASIRAGVTRFAECAWLDAGAQPMILARVEGSAAGSVARPGLPARARRMAGLAIDPLEDLHGMIGARRARAFVAVPDEAGAGLASELVAGLDRLDGMALIRDGRAGAVSAIAAAASAIAAGEIDVAIAGGVDSYVDLRTLADLDRARRLRSEANRDGFVPGEAAAFVLLGRPDASPGPALAMLGARASATEPGHLGSAEPYRGDGLSRALAGVFGSTAFAGAARQPIREVWSSMNGESHWAKELGVAAVRHGQRFADDHVLHHPADCLGDTGAACGAVMAGLAALRLARHPRLGPALICASADGAQRSVMLLEPLATGDEA